jgi:serine/threonine-protein kinase
MLGLLSALAHLLFHFFTLAIVPADVLEKNPVLPTFTVALWVAVGLGLVIYALASLRLLPDDLMLDVGLIFEVTGAFFIGLIEASLSQTQASPNPGGIALWIAFFILVVPNTIGKTSLAALSSALMGPVAVLVAAYANSQPLPPLYALLLITFPNLLAAVLAIILSRFVYSLGTAISKARELGSYQLVELLGRGGMGEVWRAQHRLLARPAAIKLIQPEVLGCSDSRETATMKRRFEREARATAMLSSPHTIDLYDFGLAEDGVFYYVMELLHGFNLQVLVEKYGPVPADRAADFLYQICLSLEEAHRSGLVHRDIKPANIFICRYGLEYDFVKVLDFGVVKWKDEPSNATQLTQTDRATGTPGFMAPEMALGVEIDARADIYALGCVGYWLLTGRLVFEEESPIATLLAHAQKEPVPVSRRTEVEVPPKLEELIMSCLRKQPEHRPASAGEIRKQLSNFGLAASWTPERAEKWWQTHMPEETAAGTEFDIETVVQADANPH